MLAIPDLRLFAGHHFPSKCRFCNKDLLLFLCFAGPHPLLSEGKAGEVEGGDRLPWVRTDATDNFAPLRSLDSYVHVYADTERTIRSINRRISTAVAGRPRLRQHGLDNRAQNLRNLSRCHRTTVSACT